MTLFIFFSLVAVICGCAAIVWFCGMIVVDILKGGWSRVAMESSEAAGFLVILILFSILIINTIQNLDVVLSSPIGVG